MANPERSASAGRSGATRVVRHLASGGMAELYIARQEAVGGFEKQLVAQDPAAALRARTRASCTMFLDEARLAAKLNHPTIVHVYDVADEGGIKYIAMEYIHGETIADIVKRGLAVGQLPAARARRAHRQPDGRRAGLRARAHASPTGTCCASSTATSRRRTSWSATRGRRRSSTSASPAPRTSCARRRASSPARRRTCRPSRCAARRVDYRSDIFSLGIILYELTLCQRLYRGPAEAVMKRIVEREGHAADGGPARLSRRAGADRDARAREAPRGSLPVGRGDARRPGGVPGRERAAQREPAGGALHERAVRADAAASARAGAGVAEPRPSRGRRAPDDDSEELDFDRRAPLACASRRRQSRRRPRRDRPAGRGRPQAAAPRPSSRRSRAAAPRQPAAADARRRSRRAERPVDLDGAIARGEAGSCSRPSSLLGIAAMVILTLR